MSLSWYLVKNHENATMRPAGEIGTELDKKLGEIESITAIQIDDLIKEEIGGLQVKHQLITLIP